MSKRIYVKSILAPVLMLPVFVTTPALAQDCSSFVPYYNALSACLDGQGVPKKNACQDVVDKSLSDKEFQKLAGISAIKGAGAAALGAVAYYLNGKRINKNSEEAIARAVEKQGQEQASQRLSNFVKRAKLIRSKLADLEQLKKVGAPAERIQVAELGVAAAQADLASEIAQMKNAPQSNAHSETAAKIARLRAVIDNPSSKPNRINNAAAELRSLAEEAARSLSTSGGNRGTPDATSLARLRVILSNSSEVQLANFDQQVGDEIKFIADKTGDAQLSNKINSASQDKLFGVVEAHLKSVDRGTRFREALKNNPKKSTLGVVALGGLLAGATGYMLADVETPKEVCKDKKFSAEEFENLKFKSSRKSKGKCEDLAFDHIDTNSIPSADACEIITREVDSFKRQLAGRMEPLFNTEKEILDCSKPVSNFVSKAITQGNLKDDVLTFIKDKTKSHGYVLITTKVPDLYEADIYLELKDRYVNWTAKPSFEFEVNKEATTVNEEVEKAKLTKHLQKGDVQAAVNNEVDTRVKLVEAYYSLACPESANAKKGVEAVKAEVAQ